MTNVVVTHVATLYRCPKCKGIGRGYIDVDGGKICAFCDGHKWIDATPLRVLASNLGIAGALCLAFRLGADCADDLWIVPRPATWKPGCGRKAP